MFRKVQFLSGKHSRSLIWAIAFVGLICFSATIYILDVAGVAGSGEVETVMQPSVEAVEAPGPKSIAGGVSVGDPARDPGQETVPRTGCEDLLLTVGPNHILNPDYVPPDLVYLSAYGIPARGSEDMLRQEATVQLGFLISAAAEDGVEILAASGYRSYWEQQGTFDWFKDAYGEDAGKLSAPPGQSEHQLGTAVDFASPDVNYELVDSFSQTSAGSWLAEHAAQYGFVLSYGKDRETDTGVRFEPWHYRYIGVENALQVKSAGETPMPLYREGIPLCYES